MIAPVATIAPTGTFNIPITTVITIIIELEVTQNPEKTYSSSLTISPIMYKSFIKYTTNPSVTTGDGLALAIRANAEIKDMEFIQFHPTALSIENDDSRFLISESVRGEGARLINQNGEYFMSSHEQKDLAPRDVVAREIFAQIANGNKVYLDATLIPVNKQQIRFPNIIKKCEENGIDTTVDYIPVSPAAHYCMGGIKTNINGETSINGLFAIGEVACTSLHGANRLASNSLLECVVTAYELVNTLSNLNLQTSNKVDDSIIDKVRKYADDIDTNCVSEIQELISMLRTVMWEKVGIIRTEISLSKALSDINEIESKFRNLIGVDTCKCSCLSEYELRNMIHVSKAIISAALLRKDSIGAHFREDSKKRQDSIKNQRDAVIEVKQNDSKIIA